jgi:hypothetical protein
MVIRGKRARREQEMARGARSALKVLMVLVLIGLGAGVVLFRSASEVRTGPLPSSRDATVRKEVRPTLSPAKFVGKAARAHEVARRIPGVLDHLYCYCECDKHKGHKSLLSCYTDGHAAT